MIRRGGKNTQKNCTKKIITMYPDNHNGVITHLEPDILECKVKWALGASPWTKLVEVGLPDHQTWLLRNLYSGQEATVRAAHGITDWFRIGKGVRQGCILSPCLFNLYAEYILSNAGLDEAQTGTKIDGKISITSDMQMTPPLWQKVKN